MASFTLLLAAGQRGERLAEAEVAEPDVGEPVEDLVGGRRACVAVVENCSAYIAEHFGEIRLPSVYSSTDAWTQVDLTVAMMPRSVYMVPSGGAGALGVGAEQRRFHAVGLRERQDRARAVQRRLSCSVASSLASHRSTTTTPSRPATTVDQR